MGLFTEKLKEMGASVLPITFFVILLHFTLTPIPADDFWRFIIGAVLIIVGLGIFLVGVDLGATPIGELSGEALVKTNKITVLLLGGLLLGFIISIAEPDLHVLSVQVEQFTADIVGRWQMVLVVSIGVGVMVMVGFWRLVKGIRLRTILWITYGLIFLLALFNSPEFHAFSFDASGSTTGAITTPFLLALAAGIAGLYEGEAEDARDRYGMVGLASAGAILAMLVQGALDSPGSYQQIDIAENIAPAYFLEPFTSSLSGVLVDSLLSIAPLALVFIVIHLGILRLKRQSVSRIMIGLFYCYFGLSLFMVGVNGGFMRVGRFIGAQLVLEHSPFLAVLAGFFLGMLTVIAEPAVHVLTDSVQKSTGGTVPRNLTLMSLAIGVAFSIVLAIIRIYVEDLMLWHILLPAYILIMILTYFTPDLFIGVAFDAGGVASGPMTATFILAFAQGAAGAHPAANILIDGFGVVALVAMSPLITIQGMGLIYKHRQRKEQQVAASEDPE